MLLGEFGSVQQANMMSFISFNTFILIIVFINCVAMVTIERSESEYFDKNDHQQILSRRRRYLAFPEGSSLQLVYDQIIGMVDTTNLHIFGITVSLAWQLPDRSTFTEENTEPPMHDTKISISDVLKETDRIDVNETSFNKNHRHFDTYYNRANYHAHKLNSEFYDYLSNKQIFHRPPLNKHSRYDDWQKYRTNKIRWNYSHDVYPALRMRRHLAYQNATHRLHSEVAHFLNHHRHTRFSLYKSIEKYLNARGENGEECIKRAICETVQIEHPTRGNKRQNPDSFVKELLRVIFSLSLHHNKEVMTNKYDNLLNEIDHNADIDCGIKYSNCSTSIWSNNFIF